MTSLSVGCPYVLKTAEFLADIGLTVLWRPGASGFIDHIEVVAGALHLDPRCSISALLHEAGHLALVPTFYRAMLSGDVHRAIGKVFDDPSVSELPPDHPTLRALLQASDPEATAWAWAAGRHLGVPDELIILDREYSGGGRDIRLALAARRYIGIHGLMHAGFCVVRATPYRPLPTYPDLAFWLQP
ncbi:hypothetical protein [Pseudomonas oryzihabitans]|uniref:Uncharacterized protein n=1 Tax=Pseudomonas oryzihabitans TaxID=47885 RepID=A0ABX3IU22_9PSED|nr:hypothetical protein [Pseudomonas psychrotolerans]ONN71218.1 hypothetical protein BVL52_12065 [Pseudomonas psychrotolerans]